MTFPSRPGVPSSYTGRLSGWHILGIAVSALCVVGVIFSMVYLVWGELSKVTVQGTIFNTAGFAVEGARVGIENDWRSDVTDDQGHYILKDMPNDVQNLEVSHPHYDSASIAIADGYSDGLLDVIITPDPKALSSLLDFYCQSHQTLHDAENGKVDLSPADKEILVTRFQETLATLMNLTGQAPTCN